MGPLCLKKSFEAKVLFLHFFVQTCKLTIDTGSGWNRKQTINMRETASEYNWAAEALCISTRPSTYVHFDAIADCWYFIVYFLLLV